MSRSVRLLVSTALLASGAALAAQTGSHPARFDVASVKPNRVGNQPPRNLSLIPDGVRVTNLPLATILWMVHRVQADQVVDVPAWAREESFDIVGKVSPGVVINADTMGVLMRDLLADRFHLETRREMRELSVYTMVQVKPGSTGPKLKPATFDCSTTAPTDRPVPAPDSGVRCGATARPGAISVHGLPLDALARLVGPMTGRVVVDRTGLTGPWDLDLEFAPEGVNPFGGAAPLAPAGAASDVPSLFTAMQEQLGLKLEAGRAPVEVVVVERLERPSPD